MTALPVPPLVELNSPSKLHFSFSSSILRHSITLAFLQHPVASLPCTPKMIRPKLSHHPTHLARYGALHNVITSFPPQRRGPRGLTYCYSTLDQYRKQRTDLLRKIYTPFSKLDQNSPEYNELARSGKVWEDYHKPADSEKQGYIRLQQVCMHMGFVQAESNA